MTVGSCRPALWTLAACVTLWQSSIAAPPLAWGDAVPCAPVAIGVDTSAATSAAGDFLGHSIGQTFLARDTLIHSLTVWRLANQYESRGGMHLYITKSDSTGRPLLRDVVLDGPTIVNPGGDGIHPIPHQWVFDPPLALPRRGRYAFFLAQSPCLGYFDVLAREGPDLYPDGWLWSTGRSLDCTLPGTLESYPLADLCFEVQFCQGSPTPVLRKSWGRLKALYR